MEFEPLTAISSVDGRYRAAAEALAPYFSEYALIRYRIRVECEYLIALTEEKALGIRALTDNERELLQKIADASLEDARIVKRIEREGYEGIPATNHDVKAAEYFIKSKIKETSLEDLSEWVHFALTSEDVNSVSYALMLRDFFEEAYLGGPLREIERTLMDLSDREASTAMLSRTHGQSASPTTFGKEMRVFAERLHRQVDVFKNTSVLAKWGGATGSYNAHAIAAPEVDWLDFSKRFIERFNAKGIGQKHYMRVLLNEFTTQIEPHDTYAEYFDYMRRINTILIDLSQDMWRYISDGWVTQKPKEGEVGSSAMPHKVNPIDFENAEGNFGVANALFEHFARKLPVSRLQRDLSDSTVERTFGTALAHTIVAQQSLVRGFGKIAVNHAAITEALEAHPEVLAEALQTVLRREGAQMPYEKLKELTRGKKITIDDIRTFIDGLDISDDVKQKLCDLTPERYIGLAVDIAQRRL
ncbi:MAG: adenylosuccinate lyase [Candidatus Kaiserbacteria bacterium]|nr:adenylosuccinate lyase [Candidatus Kaiserbacteria bacterium]